MQRRQFLSRVATVTVAAGSLLAAPSTLGAQPASGSAPASSTAAGTAPRKRVLRLAHLTDCHVLPDLDADKGLADALRHAQAQSPDLIFFGGDHIMDALGREKDNVLAQWSVWDRVLKAELKTPHRACLGNHDIWGWAFRGRPDLAGERGFGKALALDRLSLPARYYSFDQAGWHFVVLDSMQPHPGAPSGYTAALDDEQLVWLNRDLAATPPRTPICVISHIPILSATTFYDGDNEQSGAWVVPGAWMHIDSRRIKNLFRRYPNVKVCLSGHVHLADDLTYLGVRYLCNGAVSGGWWKGAYQEFGPAYALVDFFDDGTVDNRLHFYRTPATS